MLWKWILRAVLAVSSNPAVRAWAKRKARKVIDHTRANAESSIADISASAGLTPAAPKPRAIRQIRTEKDVLKPGWVVNGVRITRLLYSNAKETVYEGVEV